MKRNSRLTVVWIFLIYLPVSATIINIPGDYFTIQEGIDASTDRDTVLVQPGTYVENVNFNGHNIVLGSLFLTTGDTTYIAETVIDGNRYGTVVTFENGEDSSSAISGFTLQNGYAAYNGGGIICLSSSPVISHNIIRNNTASGVYVEGGGIICLSSSPVISHNIIENNIASGLYAEGGGIYCRGSSPRIMNNHFKYNYAWAMFSLGGAIYCDCPNSFIIGNRIISNSAKDGGGIYCRDSVTIANNIIVGNSADDGAGISCRDNNLIANNTISRNISYVHGGGILCLSPTSIFINSVIYENEPDQIFTNIELPPEIVYCNIQGGWPGEGNIDADPLFRDPDNGDFHLMSTVCGDPNDSPCIDAGDPNIIDSLLDCSWGLGTILSDMGAYGGGDSTTVGITDQPPRLPDRFALLQNYPNPFNARTIIPYNLPSDSDVTIEIFDILGRRLEIIVNESQPAGYHQTLWNAFERSSGIYFYRIQAANFSKSRRCILLK